MHEETWVQTASTQRIQEWVRSQEDCWDLQATSLAADWMRGPVSRGYSREWPSRMPDALVLLLCNTHTQISVTSTFSMTWPSDKQQHLHCPSIYQSPLNVSGGLQYPSAPLYILVDDEYMRVWAQELRLLTSATGLEGRHFLGTLGQLLAESQWVSTSVWWGKETADAEGLGLQVTW